MKKIKEIACDDGFAVRSRDEKELMDIAQNHIHKKHHMDVTKGDMMEKMTVIG